MLSHFEKSEVACLASEIDALRRENGLLQEKNDVLSRDVQGLKAEMNAMQKTLSRFVASERKEKYYQAILEERFKAGHQRIVGIGETDITTEDAHIEIKRWSKFSDVTGQLARYQRAVRKDHRSVYFFGARPKAAKIKEIYELMCEAGIEMFSFAPDDSVIRHGPEEDEDPRGHAVKVFARERLVQNPRGTVLWVDLLRAYNEWENRVGMPSTALKAEFARVGVRYQNTRIDRTPFCGVKGWTLKSCGTVIASD